MPEFAVTKGRTTNIVTADKAPKGGVPIDEYLKTLADDPDLLGIIPEATPVDPARAQAIAEQMTKGAIKKLARAHDVTGRTKMSDIELVQALLDMGVEFEPPKE